MSVKIIISEILVELENCFYAIISKFCMTQIIDNLSYLIASYWVFIPNCGEMRVYLSILSLHLRHLSFCHVLK